MRPGEAAWLAELYYQLYPKNMKAVFLGFDGTWNITCRLAIDSDHTQIMQINEWKTDSIVPFLPLADFMIIREIANLDPACAIMDPIFVKRNGQWHQEGVEHAQGLFLPEEMRI